MFKQKTAYEIRPRDWSSDVCSSDLVSASKNHKQWYQHIKRLINNPERIKLLQDNLHNTVKDTYSIEAVTANRRDLYIKTLKEFKSTKTTEEVES